MIIFRFGEGEEVTAANFDVSFVAVVGFRSYVDVDNGVVITTVIIVELIVAINMTFDDFLNAGQSSFVIFS